MSIKRFPSIMTTAQQLFDTKILKVRPESIYFSSNSVYDGTLPTISDVETKKALMEAARIIRDTDETVAFPTETVYGLGGSSLNDNSVRSIYRAKNRPSDNPLITHVSSIDQLNRKIFKQENLSKDALLVNIPENYHPLVKSLWPGPLTILLPVPSVKTLSKLTTAEQPTFAVRIPSNPVARALIALSDTPIAAPSANASTRPSPTTAMHVYHDLKSRIPLILDGGACSVGVESTVVDGLCNPPMLLRPGGFTYEEIIRLGGESWKDCKVENSKNVSKDEKVRTPGMKYRHYSPTARVVLLMPSNDGNTDKILAFNKILRDTIIKGDANKPIKKVAILTTRYLKDISLIDAELNNIEFIIRSLGTTGEDIQANLFADLRIVDEEEKVDLIFVEGVKEENEGLAIMNRLKKAAGGHCMAF